VPADAELIDISNKTIMPGLIDAHTHPVRPPPVEEGRYPFALSSSPIMALFGAMPIFRNFLEFGITTVRILHPAIPNAPELRGEWLVAIKTAVDLGLIPGPRVVAAGVVLPTGGHFQSMVPPRLMPPGWWGADGVSEVRKQTRLCLYENVDLIKILGGTGGGGLGLDGPKKQGYTIDEMKAVVEEARFKGIPVSVHAHGGSGFDATAKILERGDSMEHCTFLFEHEKAAKKMAEKGIFMVPTCAGRVIRIEREKDPLKKAELINNFKATISVSINKARKLGIKIAAGTDSSPYDFSSIGAELEGYVKYANVPTIEAITWATKNAAECLALRDVGTIQDGKIADLIVVDGDPLININVLRDKKKIEIVFKEGRLIARKGALIWN
jgi:imidazolonepropionase-like amidohydrolase